MLTTSKTGIFILEIVSSFVSLFYDLLQVERLQHSERLFESLMRLASNQKEPAGIEKPFAQIDSSIFDLPFQSELLSTLKII